MIIAVVCFLFTPASGRGLVIHIIKNQMNQIAHAAQVAFGLSILHLISTQ
jgi:hypothetical protein